MQLSTARKVVNAANPADAAAYGKAKHIIRKARKRRRQHAKRR